MDEVVAVGDELFVEKCLQKMDDFKKQGKTIVVVGHDLGLVEQWCDTALLLAEGNVIAQGDPSEVVAAYRRLLVKDGACPTGHS